MRRMTRRWTLLVAFETIYGSVWYLHDTSRIRSCSITVCCIAELHHREQRQNKRVISYEPQHKPKEYGFDR